MSLEDGRSCTAGLWVAAADERNRVELDKDPVLNPVGGGGVFVQEFGVVGDHLKQLGADPADPSLLTGG